MVVGRPDNAAQRRPAVTARTARSGPAGGRPALRLVGDLAAVLVQPGPLRIVVLVVKLLLHLGLFLGDLGGILGRG